jgi:hypothetical protein
MIGDLPTWTEIYDGRRGKNRFFKKAKPDPTFRYLSNLLARF